MEPAVRDQREDPPMRRGTAAVLTVLCLAVGGAAAAAAPGHAAHQPSSCAVSVAWTSVGWAGAAVVTGSAHATAAVPSSEKKCGGLEDVFRDICINGGDCKQYMCCTWGVCETGA
jgi:hypothetical protein